MQEITTTKNKTYKLIRSLQQKKNRMGEGLYFVEGIKSCLDAVKAKADIAFVAIKASLCPAVFDKFSHLEVYVVSDNIFDALCDTKNPEGIICVLKIKSSQNFNLSDGLYVYLDNLNDPGNCGTIIRTLDACGGVGVLLSEGSVDLYNPKTIRSSMGSFFNISAYTDVSYHTLASLKDSGFEIICTALSDTATDFKNISYKKKTVIVIGNEANGISDQCLSLADQTAVIPILGGAESLNASVAAALVMYEWQRNILK